MWPWMVALATLLAAAGAALADCNHPAAINFAPGVASATVASDDSVPTAECYQVTAQAKQELGMFIESTGKGPVLEVYAPGWTASCDAFDECSISGTLMSDPGDTEWTDTLTDTGAYLIVVDNPHSDEYRLTVEIHSSGADRQ
jgi:hypothetical protein